MQKFIDEWKNKNIRFVGINGVGVNALAKYCLACSINVSGSDRKLGDFCADLLAKGCQINEGEDETLLKNVDALVYTSAINGNNAEYLQAKKQGIPCFERHEFLSLVSHDFDKVVGIAGSHGKTTVTAMVTHILKEANKNFVSMIGGDAIKYSNFVNNISDGDRIFVTEACEYRRHMLLLEPDVAVLLNTDWDHPDSYPTRASIEDAFSKFLHKAKTQIHALDDDNSIVLNDDGYLTIFEYEKTCEAGRIYVGGEFVGTLGKNIQGEYNQKNALFAIATAYALDVKPMDATRFVNTFLGVKRRFEKVGDEKGVPVIFDFAHHPTEISSVLERAKTYGRMLVVFQPHTYSRTKAYMDEFAEVFADNKNGISTLMLLPTYAAREQYIDSADSQALFAKIMSKNAEKEVYLAKNAESCVEFVKMIAKNYDIILFVGAGDIYDLRKYFQMQK